MLYIQITTFFGSRCKLKMSCFRPNYCAARKVQFQQFFPPKHPFYLGGGYFHPRCACPQGASSPTPLRYHEGGMHQSCPAHRDNPCPCPGLPSSKLKPAPLCIPSRLVQANCDVPGRQCQRGKVLVCPCRGCSRRCPKPGGSMPAARRQVPAVLAAPHARARLINLSHPHLTFGRK